MVYMHMPVHDLAECRPCQKALPLAYELWHPLLQPHTPWWGEGPYTVLQHILHTSTHMQTSSTVCNVINSFAKRQHMYMHRATTSSSVLNF